MKKTEVIPEPLLFKQTLLKQGEVAGFIFSQLQLDQFSRYYELLIQTNNQMNLTALTSPEDVAVKHVLDSLLCFRKDRFPGASLLDVGTGAGFPGLPLKIYCPSLKVTLLDSLAKRVTFLQTVISELGLTFIDCLHARAEDAAREKNLRERFTLVTARAVAPLPVLAEYLLPFVRKGGWAVALKGSHFQEECSASAGALKKLGGYLEEIKPVILPGLADRRAIIVIKKVAATSDLYPRKAGLPAKKPLS